MKRIYLFIIVIALIGCKPSVREGLDFYDYEDFEFSVEEELSKHAFTDSINASHIEIALFKEGFLTVDYAGNLKKSVLKNALYLTDNSNFDFYGTNGLAYVWGAKDHTKKTRPVKYRKKSNKCKEELYGLDCSGFIYQIFLMSGFKFFSYGDENPSNFADSRFFSNPVKWKFPVNKYCEGIDCLKIERINEPTIGQIESGDLLFFYNSKKRTTHIGICLEYNGKLIFFDSGGNPNKDCSQAISKGPRRSILSENLLNAWKKRRHGILKITNAN
nr:NlpC/P60 family protein [uncultured Allomuricauda sp.]